MLRYPFIPGDHQPRDVQHFRSAVECLRIIHSHGFIHGGIRIENITFKDDGNSVLIDFDLARRESDEDCYYPVGYNHLKIRHKDAQMSM